MAEELDPIVRALLPLVAYVENDTNEPGQSRVLGLKRGERGFWPVYTTYPAKVLNQELGVSPAQAEAMHIGSMFGWHVPGADPRNWVTSPNGKVTFQHIEKYQP